MTREEFVKQRCEIDKITEEEFEKTYRVVDCNCGAPYCKGYRCLNLDDLLKENQELKKQVEQYQQELEKADSITHSCIFNGKKESEISFRKCLNMLEKLKNQQKEFIEWLEDYINLFDNMDIEEQASYDTIEEILQKYKEIIGDDK